MSGRGRVPTSLSGPAGGNACCSTADGCYRQPAGVRGRNATLLQHYVYLEELSRRRISQSFNPQGVDIIAASLLSFGMAEQKQRWAVPILRAEMTASLGMSESGTGLDLASLKTRAV